MQESNTSMRVFQEKMKIELDFRMKDAIDDYKKEIQGKMYQFSDSVLKEFRFLHKRLEDKIYFELGYHDKMPKLNQYLTKEAKLDDLLSVKEMSVWSNFDKEKRANSIHIFKPRRGEKKFARINWGETIELTS